MAQLQSSGPVVHDRSRVQHERYSEVRYFWIALWGVLIPAFGGFLLAEAFGFEFKSSVFVGTALTATSIAVTAHVLKEMGKLQTDAAKAIIGAAVIDDVIALLALSVSQGWFRSNCRQYQFSYCWESCRLCGACESGGQNGGQRRDGGGWTGPRLLADTRSPSSLSATIAFLYSLAAQFVGLSAIVGSFLAGVASEVKITRGGIFRTGAEHLQTIFASVFFVSLGAITDLHYMKLTFHVRPGLDCGGP